MHADQESLEFDEEDFWNWHSGEAARSGRIFRIGPSEAALDSLRRDLFALDRDLVSGKFRPRYLLIRAAQIIKELYADYLTELAMLRVSVNDKDRENESRLTRAIFDREMFSESEYWWVVDEVWAEGAEVDLLASKPASDLLEVVRCIRALSGQPESTDFHDEEIEIAISTCDLSKSDQYDIDEKRVAAVLAYFLKAARSSPMSSRKVPD